ncbi:MAG: hypothetical protein HF975_04495 [ANME-2 cluster archaeon]|nr:hypothetical protein [ANME-2 cluster archaeon]
MTIVGSDIPSGDEVKWYMGGAEATLIQEDLVEVAGIITLSKNAEYGSVFTVDSNGDPTDQMLEFLTDGTSPATEAAGTKKVRTSAAGTDTMTAYYLDNETTSLVQVMACKDVSSSMDIDTKETEVHGQTQKLQKTGAATRTASLEEVDYNDDFVAALFGDQVSASPAADQSKWTDNFTGAKKISALIGKQIQGGTLKKKWFLMGCQVSSIEHSFPTADYYAKSMEFLVDYMVSVEL